MRFESYKIPISVSLCAPAVRTVVVYAWINDESDPPRQHEVYPVVALRAVIATTMSRKATGDGKTHYQPSTRELAEEAGWVHDWTDSGVEPLIVEADFGVCTIADIDGSNSAAVAVACPWPPSEDASRLAPFVAKAFELAELSIKFAEHRRQEAKAAN